MRAQNSACALLTGYSATTKETPQNGHWLPPRAAAEYCAMGFSTFAKLRISGEGAPFSKVGKKVLYNRNDLDNWLASKRIASTSQVEG